MIVRNSRDQFIGPFGIQLHTPDVGQVFLNFTLAIHAIPGLPDAARETAILTVAARTGAKYEN